MKTIFWYTSWSGHTALYADWLSKEIKKAPIPASEIDLSELSDYDLIIYGGPVHTDEILGFERIRKILPYLEGKKLIVFAVGGVPPSEENDEKVKAKTFAGLDMENISYFYLRGGFDHERLTGLHRLQVWYYKFLLKRKKIENLSEGEKNLLYTYEHPDNYTEKENLKPLAEYILKVQRENRKERLF